MLFTQKKENMNAECVRNDLRREALSLDIFAKLIPEKLYRLFFGFRMKDESNGSKETKTLAEKLDNYADIPDKILVQSIKHERIDCRLCKKNFCSKKSLKLHKVNVHSKKLTNINTIRNSNKDLDGSTVEDYLQNSAKNVSHISLNEKNATPVKSSVKCTVCSKELPNSQRLTRHMRNHRQKIHLCDLCPSRFSLPSMLEYHKKVCHFKTERVNCDLCGKSLCNKTSLNLHKTKVHLKDFKYNCDICKKGFLSNSELRKHKKGMHEGITYRCKDCPKIFKMEAYLKNHSLAVHNHNSEEKECTQCKRHFPNLKLFQKHFYVRHKNQTKLICETCGKNISPGYMKIHMRIHNGEKPFICKICEKGFSKMQELKVHTRIHTGEKPYLCDVCSKSFNQVNSLKRHKRIHTREKRYSCDICHKNFISKSLWNQHVCQVDNKSTSFSV